MGGRWAVGGGVEVRRSRLGSNGPARRGAPWRAAAVSAAKWMWRCYGLALALAAYGDAGVTCSHHMGMLAGSTPLTSEGSTRSHDCCSSAPNFTWTCTRTQSTARSSSALARRNRPISERRRAARASARARASSARRVASSTSPSDTAPFPCPPPRASILALRSASLCTASSVSAATLRVLSASFTPPISRSQSSMTARARRASSSD
mmetsp:Transcript_55885/g.116913  ORF Transcript_55885/g.116913 Transcript_55885/m.116913 type:complete len:207 (+) Transcript_55885:33-653(+)